MGLTLDTGALVALEQRDTRTIALIHAAQRQGQAITVPAPVVVEWWRGQRGPAANLLRAFNVEPLGNKLAHIAGTALAAEARGSARERNKVKGPSVTDAVVMASAALRGDTVLTGDIQDLTHLQLFFPAVKLLRV